MQRIPLKQYAVKHKMSLFQVIKAVREGKLPSETVEEEGKEVTYVLVEDTTPSAKTEAKCKSGEKNLREEIAALKSEVKLLKREVAQLKKMIGGGVIL